MAEDAIGAAVCTVGGIHFVSLPNQEVVHGHGTATWKNKRAELCQEKLLNSVLLIIATLFNSSLV